MPKPFFTARHVRTLAELPAKLTVDRVYFVDDEAYIIIDHGNGPVIYGNKAGQQGQPGEPIPILQAQIDQLTAASINTSRNLYKLNQDSKNKLSGDIENEKKTRYEQISSIYDQLEHLSSAILTLTKITSDIYENLKGTEGALLKLLLDNESHSTITPLKQYDVLTVDDKSWTISEAAITAEGGTLIFTLNN